MPLRRWMWSPGRPMARLTRMRSGVSGLGLRKTMTSPWRMSRKWSKGAQRRGRGEGGAVDQDVVADQQRLLHGARGDLEVLEDEGLGEEDQDEQRCRWRRATRAGFRSGASRGRTGSRGVRRAWSRSAWSAWSTASPDLGQCIACWGVGESGRVSGRCGGCGPSGRSG